MPRLYPWIVNNNETEVKQRINEALASFNSDEVKALFASSSDKSNEDKYLCLSLLVTNHIWFQLSKGNRTSRKIDATNIINRNSFLSDDAKCLLRLFVIESPELKLENIKQTSVSFLAMMSCIESFPNPLNLLCITNLFNADLSDRKDMWGNLLTYSLASEDYGNMQSFYSLKLHQLLHHYNHIYFSASNFNEDENSSFSSVPPELTTALGHSIYEANLSDIYHVLCALDIEERVIEESNMHVSMGLMQHFIKAMPEGNRKEFYFEKLNCIESNKKKSNLPFSIYKLFDLNNTQNKRNSIVYPQGVEHDEMPISNHVKIKPKLMK